MIKHAGRHNNKKVAIMYKVVPDEEHMCLLVYTETIPSRLHDELMSVLESAAGQGENDLADAAFRHTMADGTNCLTSIHKGGYMKKVPCKQVIITANSNSQIRLDELNNLLKEMATGEEAVSRLQEIDDNAGMRNIDHQNQAAISKTTSAGMTGEGPTDAARAAMDLLREDLDIDVKGVNTVSPTKTVSEAAQLKADAKELRSKARQLTVDAKALDAKANALTPKKVRNVRKTKAGSKTQKA